MTQRRKWLQGLAVSAVGVARPLLAATPAGPPIRIGQTAVLSGPLGGPMLQFNGGATLAFDEVNRQGGIAGRPIQLLSRDDRLDPALAVSNMKTLLAGDPVVAFFGAVGSANVAATAPVLRDSGVPSIGNYAVPDGVRAALKDNAYFVRATYGREMERLVELLVVIGNTRLGLIHLANPGGEAVLAQLRTTLAAKSPQSTLVAAAVANDAHDAEAAARTVAAARPQAVILFIAGPPVARVMTTLWDAGANPMCFGMSIVDGALIARLLGKRLRNLAAAQVVPYPWSDANESARLFRARQTAARRAVDYPAFEGWINGLVMIEALRRCGARPTPEALHNAMRGLKTRVADLDLDFTGGRQTGSHFVELVAVRADGSFVR